MAYDKEYSKKWREKYFANPINRERRKKLGNEWNKRKREELLKLGIIKPRWGRFPEFRGLKPKERLRAIRFKVLNHYGGIPPKCQCCEEKEIKFLSIDHINGGGNKHRKTITKSGKGGNMHWWLLKHNFPKGFQVLCHNCNMAKGFYGNCPHKML